MDEHLILRLRGTMPSIPAMRDAANEIERLGAEVEQVTAERGALRDALDHIARVGMGSRKMTNRTAWIVERAKSALNGDDEWKYARKPHGYHDALADKRANSDSASGRVS